MTTNVKKKSTAQGAKFSYKYSDMATIHEELAQQGITYYQFTEYDEKAGADYIFTVLKHGDKEEGKPLRGARIAADGSLAGGNAAQQYGSALTYARRYSLLLALGWATEDDDAAGAAPAQTQPQSHQGPIEGRLDFEKLKAWLSTMHTHVELLEAKKHCFEKYPNMTEKQRNAIERIFAERSDDIDNPREPDGWQETIKL